MHLLTHIFQKKRVLKLNIEEMNLPKACNNIFVDFFCMCVFFCRTDLYSTSPFQGEELCLHFIKIEFIFK